MTHPAITTATVPILLLQILLTAGARAREPAVALPLHRDQDAYTPMAAWGKESGLVLWQSGRIAPGDLSKEAVFIGDIVGCLIDATGKPLTPQPFVVSGAADLQEASHLAFNGEIFLAVWQDLRNTRDWDVFAARISADGKVLDAEGILIAGGERSQAQPRVAWNGRCFVVAWQDLRSQKFYEVVASRVSADGRLLDPAGIVVSTRSDGHRYAPAIASLGGGTSLITWASNKHGFGNDIWSGACLLTETEARECYRFDNGKWYTDGRKIGPIRCCVPTFVAAGRENYLWVWTTHAPMGRGIPSAKNNATLFDRDGKRLIDVMTLSGADHHIISPHAVWTGAGYVAGWTELMQDPARREPLHERVFAARLDAQGKTSGAVAIAGKKDAPARGVTVCSPGGGAALVCFEQHPATAEQPIHIAVRVLK